MKKILKTLPAVALMAMAMVSCSSNESAKDSTASKDSAASKDSTKNSKSTKADEGTALLPLTPPVFDIPANIDTLSYANGYFMATAIEQATTPPLKADYNVILSAFSNATKHGKIEVNGEIITKENISTLNTKYFTPEIQSRFFEAMQDSTGKTEVFENKKEKEIASAIIGASLAYALNDSPFETIDMNSILTAINDVHNGNAKIDEKSAMAIMQNYYTVVIPANNKKASEEWLASIEKQDGVKKAGSGLLYKVIKEGDKNTRATKDTDVVKVLYTGKTRKDKVFDSNRWTDMTQQRKEMIKTHQPSQANKDNPIEFALSQVIKGWTEGMKLIGKGGRIHLWIPAELAYGERGVGQDIGPNEALFFDVELLEVTSK